MADNNLSCRAPIGGALADPALVAIDAEAARFASAATAINTRAAYRTGLRDFAAWCSDFDLVPAPALPVTVARYITDLAARGRTVSTIKQRVAAIAHAHRALGLDSPTSHDVVRRVMSGIRRTVGRPPARKRALTVDLVAKVIRKIPARDPRGLRDRAMILLAFGAALRRSELVALDVSDLEWDRRGLLVRLRRSKTDQSGDGQTVAVPDGKLKIGATVRAWLETSQICDGPAFRGFDQAGAIMPTAISAGQFARLLKGRCSAAGLDAALFSGHSPRRGFASSASDEGADIRRIGRHLRHAKLETTAGYIEDGELFRQHAGKGVL